VAWQKNVKRKKEELKSRKVPGDRQSNKNKDVSIYLNDLAIFIRNNFNVWIIKAERCDITGSSKRKSHSQIDDRIIVLHSNFVFRIEENRS
jgi:hypothetical protein